MSFKGTIRERALVAAAVGSDIEVAAIKATSQDPVPPKPKHVASMGPPLRSSSSVLLSLLPLLVPHLCSWSHSSFLFLFSSFSQTALKEAAKSKSVPAGDIYLALGDRIKDNHWVIVLKGLEVIHELIREPHTGALSYLSTHLGVLNTSGFRSRVTTSGLCPSSPHQVAVSPCDLSFL